MDARSQIQEQTNISSLPRLIKISMHFKRYDGLCLIDFRAGQASFSFCRSLTRNRTRKPFTLSHPVLFSASAVCYKMRDRLAAIFPQTSAHVMHESCQSRLEHTDKFSVLVIWFEKQAGVELAIEQSTAARGSRQQFCKF